MVSTRQMSIVSGSIGECSGGEHGTSRNTRNHAPIICSDAIPGPSRAGQQRQNVFFLDLPQEVIEKILSYMTFKNVCQLRLVSRFDFVFLLEVNS